MLNTVLRKRIIFIVLHLFTLLLLAEIACRVKYYLASDDPGYLFSPFIDVQFIQQQKNAPPPTKTAEIINSDTINKDTLLYSPCRDSLLLKTYNDYGWPGPQIAETKPEEIFRILVVGGSTVESPYNGNIDTWCYRLGKLLNKKPSLEAKVEVINAGKAGGNVFRIHKRLKQNGFRLNPDMILYYEAGNDMTEVNSWQLTDRNVSALNKTLLGFLHYRSMLYTYLIEKYSFYRINKNRYGNHKKIFANYFGWIVKDCLKRGIDFVYVKQACNFPIRKYGYDLRNMNDIQSLIDSLTSLRDGGEIPQAERDGYWLALRSAEQRLIVAVESAICREKGGFVVDPLPDFEKARNEAQPLFRDIVHKTCFGDSVLALSVYNSIKDKVADLYTQKKHAR